MTQIYEFGPFRLDERAGKVIRDHQELHLTAKGYATLLFLVQRAGSLVLKDELLDHVWPEGFVEPANLTQTIYVLRKTLDDADARVIETVPGRGYRFAAPVKLIELGQPQDTRPLWVKLASPIAAAIIVAVTLALHSSTSSAGQTAVISAEAHRDYVLGRYYWSQRTYQSVILGLRYFKAATQISPAFAQAYSGIADSYAILAYYDVGAPERARNLELARDAALQAISLDPNVAEAHASLAFADNLTSRYEGGYEAEAGREFQRSIALDANYATAREWYSWFLFYHHDAQGALAQMEQARDLDPLSPIINFALANQLFFSRRYEEAAEQWHTAISIDPSTEIGYYGAGLADEQLGNFNLAVQEFRHALSLSPRDPDTIGALAHALARMQQPDSARRLLAKIAAMRPTPAYDLALVNEALGQKGAALRWLEIARSHHDRNFTSLLFDPRMDALRREADAPKDIRSNA